MYQQPGKALCLDLSRGLAAPATGVRRILLLAMLMGAGCGHPAGVPSASGGKAAQRAGRGSPQQQARRVLGAHTHSTWLEFKTQPRHLTAGQPAIWALKIFDARSNDPLRTFQVVHEKLLHLIVVSKDLTWFNHVHPEYKDNGLFLIRTVLPHEGTYKLYADYTPQGGRQEVAQQEFEAAPPEGLQPPGDRLPPGTPQLVADNVGQGRTVTREVDSSEEEQPDTVGQPGAPAGAHYRVTLQLQWPTKLATLQDALLHFRVLDSGGREVTDLQPYLGAMGHAVILSADSEIYLHTHPITLDQVLSVLRMNGAVQPRINASDVFFYTRFPAPGLYKFWAQFRHQNRLIVAPFVLNVAAGTPHPPPGETTEKTTGTRGGQARFVCPMHPDVTGNDPNAICPRCGMSLVPRS